MNAVLPQLPALQVVVPLLGAVLVAFLAPQPAGVSDRAGRELGDARHLPSCC